MPQTSPLALTREINMRNPFSFAALKSWGRVFEDKSEPAQRAIYADPGFRDAFREEMKQATGFSGNWRRITVHEVQKPELKHYEGRKIADVAQARGKDRSTRFLIWRSKTGSTSSYVLAQFNIDEKLSPTI